VPISKVMTVPRVNPGSRTFPTRPIPPRERCHQLVLLEQRLSRQRKLIAGLKARSLDASAEQSELARLLSELDALLGKPSSESASSAAAS
jgi:hypothetical protein